MNPTSASGHCRVTVVAPNTRVDVALPEDVPLADLLPEIHRLLNDPVGRSNSANGGFGGGGGAGAGAGVGGGAGAGVGIAAGVASPSTFPSTPLIAAPRSGYVLTRSGARVLDTALSLHAQGVTHGELLRLCPASDLPETPVHDDIVDAVAEALIGAGRMWTATALRATALTIVALAFGLGAVALWFSAVGQPRGFHGRTGVIAGFVAVLLLGGGIWRARRVMPVRGRGSYYLTGVTAGAGGGPSGRLSAAGLGSMASASSSVSASASGSASASSPDRAAAAVLTACSLPYAFIAGVGVVGVGVTQGVGRAQFTAGAAMLAGAAIVALVGLGRRVSAAVAGIVIGVVGSLAGIGMAVTGCSAASAAAVVVALVGLTIEVLPLAAMYLARFVIDPPDPDAAEIHAAPVDRSAVADRVLRTRELMLGLVAGVSLLIVMGTAVLLTRVDAFGLGPGHARKEQWTQVLTAMVATLALCRARLFHERGPVLALVVGPVVALTSVGVGMTAGASAAERGTWILAGLVGLAVVALAFASVRVRGNGSGVQLPPQWSRVVDGVEMALVLGILPVLLAVLGVYGEVRAMPR